MNQTKKELSYFRLKLERLPQRPSSRAKDRQRLHRRLAPILLGNKSIQAVFSKYDLRDDFDGSREYEQLYTELTGTILLLIEENHLPIVDKAEIYVQE